MSRRPAPRFYPADADAAITAITAILRRIELHHRAHHRRTCRRCGCLIHPTETCPNCRRRSTP